MTVRSFVACPFFDPELPIRECDPSSWREVYCSSDAAAIVLLVEHLRRFHPDALQAIRMVDELPVALIHPLAGR